MGIKFSNNASTTLASGITAAATTLSVAAGTGAEFPTLAAGDYFYATIVSAADPAVFEIVKVTARSTDTFTIVRAQESTTAAAWTAGAKVDLRFTAQGLAEATDLDNMEGGPTLSGYREKVVSATLTTNQAYACDLATANLFALTLDGTHALSFTNAPSQAGTAISFTIYVTQGGTGNDLLTYPASVKWSDAIVPVLATQAGKIDVLTFMSVDQGATWLGAHAFANC